MSRAQRPSRSRSGSWMATSSSAMRPERINTPGQSSPARGRRPPPSSRPGDAARGILHPSPSGPGWPRPPRCGVTGELMRTKSRCWLVLAVLVVVGCGKEDNSADTDQATQELQKAQTALSQHSEKSDQQRGCDRTAAARAGPPAAGAGRQTEVARAAEAGARRGEGEPEQGARGLCRRGQGAVRQAGGLAGHPRDPDRRQDPRTP